MDLLTPVLSFKEIATDFSIFIAFSTLFFITLRKLTIGSIHPAFGVLMIILLGINFLEFGGITGTNCLNYYSGIYVTVMLYSGRTLYRMLAFQLALVAALIYLITIDHPIYQNVLISVNRDGKGEFIFSLLALSIFAFYLKDITVSEINKHQLKIDELRIKVKESKNLNHRLVSQSDKLNDAQQVLKKEVSRRVEALSLRQEAIEQYIHHNTTTLKDPLQQLSTVVEQFRGDTQLHTLLQVSHAELNQVVTNINKALAEESLHRSTIGKQS